MASDEVPGRIRAPYGSITLTMGGKAIEFGVEQPQYDFSALRITVMREPPIDTEYPRKEDDLDARVEAYINSARELQAQEMHIAGADSNGDVLTNRTRYYVYGDNPKKSYDGAEEMSSEQKEHLKRWLYGSRPPWTQHTLEVDIGLRVQVVSMSRVRLYLPRSRRHDYPEVKAWIRMHAPVHVRATLYLERR